MRQQEQALSAAETDVRGALSQMGVAVDAIRARTVADPIDPTQTMEGGVVRTADGDFFYYVKAPATPLSLVKADTADKRQEAEYLWSSMDGGGPDAGGTIISPMTPRPSATVAQNPNQTSGIHAHSPSGLQPETVKAMNHNLDVPVDPVEMLMGATATLRKAAGRFAPAARLAEHEARFLRELGYSAADIESGAAKMTRSHKLRCAEWKARELRKSLDDLSKIEPE